MADLLNSHVTWKAPLSFPGDAPKLFCEEIKLSHSLEPNCPQAFPIALVSLRFVWRKRAIKHLNYVKISSTDFILAWWKTVPFSDVSPFTCRQHSRWNKVQIFKSPYILTNYPTTLRCCAASVCPYMLGPISILGCDTVHYKGCFPL